MLSTTLRNCRTLPGQSKAISRRRGRRRHALDRLLVPLGELADEMFDQQRNVLAPLDQPRQADRHDLQPVVQIAAKRAAAICCSRLRLVAETNADVDLDRVVRADARDLVVFQHAQQLDLRGHRHVADFVQKQRAAVGVLELADAIASRRR